MPRIISLISSATEIVHALGFGEHLVGRSHECDYPASVQSLPVCTEAKFDPDGTSYQIDQRVKAILQEAVSVYRIDAGLLDRLAPDLILTQSQCEVCAVSFKDVAAAASQLIASQPRLVSLEPNVLEDVWGDIRRVAAALEVAERGAEVVAQLHGRTEAVVQQVQVLAERPRVACIEWIEPLMAAGNWVPELVEMAGGKNLFGVAGAHSPWMEWEELQEQDPDVIVVLPCGYDIEKSRSEMGGITAQSGWSDLQAVRAGRVYLTDGNQYFNRPGPRLAESLEILAEVLHPRAFQYGYEGRGWQKFSI